MTTTYTKIVARYYGPIWQPGISVAKEMVITKDDLKISRDQDINDICADDILDYLAAHDGDLSCIDAFTAERVEVIAMTILGTATRAGVEREYVREITDTYTEVLSAFSDAEKVAWYHCMYGDEEENGR